MPGDDIKTALKRKRVNKKENSGNSSDSSDSGRSIERKEGKVVDVYRLPKQPKKREKLDPESQGSSSKGALEKNVVKESPQGIGESAAESARRRLSTDVPSILEEVRDVDTASQAEDVFYVAFSDNHPDMLDLFAQHIGELDEYIGKNKDRLYNRVDDASGVFKQSNVSLKTDIEGFLQDVDAVYERGERSPLEVRELIKREISIYEKHMGLIHQQIDNADTMISDSNERNVLRKSAINRSGDLEEDIEALKDRDVEDYQEAFDEVKQSAIERRNEIVRQADSYIGRTTDEMGTAVKTARTVLVEKKRVAQEEISIINEGDVDKIVNILEEEQKRVEKGLDATRVVSIEQEKFLHEDEVGLQELRDDAVKHLKDMEKSFIPYIRTYMIMEQGKDQEAFFETLPHEKLSMEQVLSLSYPQQIMSHLSNMFGRYTQLYDLDLSLDTKLQSGSTDAKAQPGPLQKGKDVLSDPGSSQQGTEVPFRLSIQEQKQLTQWNTRRSIFSLNSALNQETVEDPQRVDQRVAIIISKRALYLQRSLPFVFNQSLMEQRQNIMQFTGAAQMNARRLREVEACVDGIKEASIAESHDSSFLDNSKALLRNVRMWVFQQQEGKHRQSKPLLVHMDRLMDSVPQVLTFFDHAHLQNSLDHLFFETVDPFLANNEEILGKNDKEVFSSGHEVVKNIRSMDDTFKENLIKIKNSAEQYAQILRDINAEKQHFFSRARNDDPDEEMSQHVREMLDSKEWADVIGEWNTSVKDFRDEAKPLEEKKMVDFNIVVRLMNKYIPIRQTQPTEHA